MLSNINMILLFDFSSENDEKLFGQIPRIADMLPFEVKFWFEEVKKILCFSIFEMELYKEVTFDQICNLVSGLFFNIFEKFLLDDGINLFIEGQ